MVSVGRTKGVGGAFMVSIGVNHCQPVSAIRRNLMGPRMANSRKQKPEASRKGRQDAKDKRKSESHKRAQRSTKRPTSKKALVNCSDEGFMDNEGAKDQRTAVVEKFSA